MSTRKGVGGREVPGAELASTGGTERIGYKKKKKGGKKHKETQDIGETNQSDVPLVNGVETPNEKHTEAIKPSSDDKAYAGGATSQVSTVAIEQCTEDNAIPAAARQDSCQASSPSADITNGHVNEQLPKLTIPDSTNHVAENDLQETLPNGVSENGLHENVSNGVSENGSHDKLSNGTSENGSHEKLYSGAPEKGWAQHTTPSEWSDSVVGDILSRTTPDGAQHPYDHIDTKRRAVQDWFDSQRKPAYRDISMVLRQRIVDHLYHIKYTKGYDEEWNKTLRLMVWKAVVRANCFWTYNGVPTGKAKPVVRPSGVYENHFEAFVQCAAERLDRINRDLPSPDYVKKVEDEVRGFLAKVENAGMNKQLKHLAFLLLFDEEQGKKNALSLEEMQERIRRAFVDTRLDLKGFEFMKKAHKPAASASPSHSVSVADAIWRDAVSKL